MYSGTSPKRHLRNKDTWLITMAEIREFLVFKMIFLLVLNFACVGVLLSPFSQDKSLERPNWIGWCPCFAAAVVKMWFINSSSVSLAWVASNTAQASTQVPAFHHLSCLLHYLKHIITQQLQCTVERGSVKDTWNKDTWLITMTESRLYILFSPLK